MACISHVLCLVLCVLLLSLLCLAQEERRSDIPRCPHFSCGSLGNIGFPFSNRTHPECGLLVVDKCTESAQTIQLGKGGPWFDITRIYQDSIVELRDQNSAEQLWKKCSTKSLKNLTLPISPFLSFGVPNTQQSFQCPLNYTIPKNFSSLCNNSQHSYIQYKTVHVTDECYGCFMAGGQCQSDSKGKFNCSVTGRKNYGEVLGLIPGNGKLGLKLGIGVGISVSITGMLIILAFCFYRSFSSIYTSIAFWNKKTKSHQIIEEFLRNHGSLALKRYNYSDVKVMTNSFKLKVGQGGYGGVYKGRLHDGHNVAVKVLTESKGNGEEFINEVASISRTAHVNIVTLLGYCVEGHRRALIYEFMSNGSLEKFIDEKNPLRWETLYQITIGIARGLEYLHRGCSTKILHFDIKPHNILLDQDFCPKISDFGLAKICPKKESIISMTGARGTIGYIAPEVFSRHFGKVSHKSDVYSYGMMVLEMTGGRQNKNVGVDDSSEIYFPQWIYDRLEDEELGLEGISNVEDRECIRKMIIVSLWCIQTKPSDRPTISEVVDMLESSLDLLQIPPRPFLSSPPRSKADS